MKEWLARLDEREQLILGAGGLALVLLLAYALVWEPFSAEHARLQQSVTSQRELAAWMETVTAEADRLRAVATPQGSLPAGQSLLTAVDRTTKSAGLGGAIRRIEPEGPDTVRVWLEGARFEVLARWLVGLEQRFGVAASSANLERGDNPGQVDARLTLTTGAAP